jgi:hypothetical protein
VPYDLPATLQFNKNPSIASLSYGHPDVEDRQVGDPDGIGKNPEKVNSFVGLNL